MSDNHDLDTATSAVSARLPQDRDRGRGDRPSPALGASPGACARRAATRSASASSAAAAAAPARPSDVAQLAPGVTLVALGDAFEDRLDEAATQPAEEARRRRSTCPTTARSSASTPTRRSSRPTSNYIILATPPGFRPLHLEAAVAAGKHIFTEKPVAVDGPGIRNVLDVYEEAKAKNLGDRRRHAAAAPGRLPRDDEAHPRRRDRRDRRRRAATGTRAASGTSPARRRGATWSGRCATGSTSPGSPATTSSSSTSTTSTSSTGRCRRHPVRARRHGRPPGPDRPRLRPHLRPLRGRLRVPRTACHCMSMCRQIAGCDNNVSEAARRHQGARARPGASYTINGANAWQFRGEENNPVRAGAHRPDRQHPRGQAAQRAEERRREHADGDHGPHVGVHRQGVTWEQALDSKETWGRSR